MLVNNRKSLVIEDMYKGERFNSISHLIGALFALAGAVIVVVSAAEHGGAIRIVSFSIYGATLFLLYLMSTLYHSIPGKYKHVLKILDHQAIYLLIAGTYTPFTLVALKGVVGWVIFGAVWGLALIGIVLDALPRKGKRIVPIFIYIFMGWICLFSLDSLIHSIPEQGFFWLLLGGVIYTSGILFYILDHWYPWTHGIWHLFVLAGSICHYISIVFYI